MIQFLSIIILFLDISSSCKPSAEGEIYVFSQVFKHDLEERLELVWLKNTIPMSTCRWNMACYNYNIHGTVTTLRSLGGGLFESNYTLKNVNRTDVGTMYLKYLGLASLKHAQPLFDCTLLVYAFSVLTLQDCPAIVEEGSEVKCLCKKRDDILEEVVLYWLDHNGTAQNGGSQLLYFVAGESILDYTCRGWKSDGVESKPLEYRPIILSYNSEKNVIDDPEPSFSITVILIIICATSVLILSVLVMVFHCLTKERFYSKISFKRFKDLSKDRKKGCNLLHTLDYPVTFYDDNIKLYSLVNTKSFDNKNSKSIGNRVNFYDILQTTELNIINNSEESEGYVSMGEDNTWFM